MGDRRVTSDFGVGRDSARACHCTRYLLCAVKRRMSQFDWPQLFDDRGQFLLAPGNLMPRSRRWRGALRIPVPKAPGSTEVHANRECRCTAIVKIRPVGFAHQQLESCSRVRIQVRELFAMRFSRRLS